MINGSSIKPTPTQAGPSRDMAMDFTKGALVLFMVLYHWLNYFIGPQGQYYNYLRFLTPSFIFISGFMISQIHLPRYQGSGRSLASRLTVRGLKLLAVFSFLNILIVLCFSRFHVSYMAMGKSLQNLCWAFLIANPTASEGPRSISFSMLVPIAYLLILSAGLIAMTRRGDRERYAFSYALLGLVVAVIAATAYGIVNSYLGLLMIGVFGVVVGFTERRQIAIVLRHPYLLVVLYGCYLAAITKWGVPLPLQLLSVILTTALLYMAGSSGVADGLLQRLIILLGKYSLLGYISQIAILQGLKRISWLSQHGAGALLGSLLLAALLTITVVEAADFATRKWKLANGLYRLVFA